MAGGRQAAEWVGIDVGGTFTDFVWLADGRAHVHKVPSSRVDQGGVIVRGLKDLGVDAAAAVVHGTTAATNALLERRGSRTALLTTEGFADVLVIGRQNRPHLYRLSQERPPPLVPEGWRLDVPERLDAGGDVVRPLDEATIVAFAELLRRDGIESIAVVLLFSFRNPVHERRIGELLKVHLPDVPVSLSSDLLPEYREYERTTTVVINAYVRPVVAGYLSRLAEALGSRRVRVMQSNGGAIGLRGAASEAARLVLSGPAGGVVGAFAVARQAMGTASPHVLTFDMGGTSTDVALCPGHLPRTTESEIAGMPLRLPSTDIHTVGAGGGSIARVDAGGVLRVGPESAGADPGPACYDLGGTLPTVTDANLVLGRLASNQFLGGGGEATLDDRAAREALTSLGATLGVTPEAAALGVVRVANAAMERALRRVSVERGYDPRDYTLVPFGGAGPLHACALAAALGMRRIVVPLHPGVLSAFGLLMADAVHESSRALLQPAEALLDDVSPLAAGVEELLGALRASAAFGADTPVTASTSVDVRYRGQSYELEVPLALPVTQETLANTLEAFHGRHAQRYGHADPSEPTEVVTVRARLSAPGYRPAIQGSPRTTTPVSAASIGTRDVWFDDPTPTPTPCYARDRLLHGHVLTGPAIVHQYDTTVVLLPGWHAHVDDVRNLIMEPNRAQGRR